MDTARQNAGETPQVNKFLVRLVAGLGLLLVFLFVLVIGLAVYKMKNPSRTVGEAPKDVILNLGLPAEEAVTNAALVGDKLTIATASRVVVVEVPSKRILIDVRAHRE